MDCTVPSNRSSDAGCFLTLPLGTVSLRHFQGLERHRLRKHPRDRPAPRLFNHFSAS